MPLHAATLLCSVLSRPAAGGTSRRVCDHLSIGPGEERTDVGSGSRAPLDDAEAAQVFRRAAEWAHPAPGDAQQLEAGALTEIGALVGLPEEAVQRAVREQRLGLLERAPRRWPRLEGSGVAEAEDVLVGDRETVEHAVAAALEAAGLEATATWGERSRWQPRLDLRRRVRGAWAARTALRAVSRVDVRLRSVEELTRVRLKGRLGAPRWLAALAAWAMVVFFSPLVVAGLVAGDDGVVVDATFTALVFVAPMLGSVLLARASLRRARRHVRESLATALSHARGRASTPG